MSLYLLSGAVCRRSTPMSFYHAYSIVSSFLTNLDQQWKDLQQQCLNTTVIYMYVYYILSMNHSHLSCIMHIYVLTVCQSMLKKCKIILKKHAGMFISMNDI